MVFLLEKWSDITLFITNKLPVHVARSDVEGNPEKRCVQQIVEYLQAVTGAL